MTLAVIQGDIYAAQGGFNAVLADRSISFEREASFAVQVLSANDYALKVAMGNRQSVVNAVTNLAAIGLSLNPAKKQAYLVPRDGKICLDVSYMGLVELAVASGSVRWVKAELVRQSDGFRLNGFDKPPTHDYEPFAKERGPVVGVYCVAKTIDGDYLADTMSIDEIYDIRNRSSAWKAWVSSQKKCPWVTDEGEMIKKTIVKRASKMWPKTDRLDQAIHHLNTDGNEGLDLGGTESPELPALQLNVLLKKVGEAADLAGLEQVWRSAAKSAQEAKDRPGYEQLKNAVLSRKADLEKQLKSQEGVIDV